MPARRPPDSSSNCILLTCPDRTRAVPCTVRAVTGEFHDPEYARNERCRLSNQRSSPSSRGMNSPDRTAGLYTANKARDAQIADYSLSL